MSRDAAIGLIRRGRSFLLACHRAPDADALGSALGLAAVLRAAGKDAAVFCPDPIPLSLGFLTADVELLQSVPDGATYDATFVLDIGAKSLLPRGFPPPEVSGPVVVVDHHATSDDFGDVIVREDDACATGELVLRLMDDLGISPIPAAAAKPLYAAIVADTGGFRYGSTRPATLRAAADLLEAGVDPWQVAYNLFEGWRPERLALMSRAFDTLQLHLDGRMATMHITAAMLAQCGAIPEMVEGIVGFARGLRGVEVGAVCWERGLRTIDGVEAVPVTKVSLRASGTVDVASIAVALGGGGHRAAAAAEVPRSLVETEAAVIVETKRVLEG